MARLNLFCLLLCCVMISSTPVQAQLGKRHTNAVTAFVSEWMKAENVPGAAVAATVRGKVVYNKAFGLSDVENQLAAQTRSVFRLASVSKPITAVAVMQLVEQGKIDLDAPAEQYLPMFPKKQWSFTVRQLLGHQSGIRHYQGLEEEYSIGARRYKDLNEAITIFSNDSLRHRPGERYSYTTFGYSLLGAVIEAVSGLSFEEYIRTRICAPAGMTSTYMDRSTDIIPFRTRGYAVDTLGRLRNAVAIDPNYKFPGGGIVSTAGDMARFASAVMSGKLIRPETFALMTTMGTLADGTTTGYGLGWSLGTAAAPEAVLHKGMQQGTTTVLLLLPQKECAVVVLTNREQTGKIIETATEIARIAAAAQR
ncbi:MAG: beta-lactamase family protein [Bacteroidetes bacterium]|nr:beta-lactamase family protein [Bacteroidota bacterium]